MIRRILLAIAAICFVSPLVRAQTLADKLPDDAILYVGWAGSESLGAAYEGSHLKAMLADSNFPQLFSEFLPRVIQRIGAKEPQAIEIYRLVAAIGEPMWRHPSALYLAAPENPGAEPPRVILLCSAGADAQKLETNIQQALAKSQNTQLPISVKTLAGGLVVISTTEYAEKPTAPLIASASFKSAMANVAKDPIATIYLDIDRTVAVLDATAPKDP